MLLAAPNRPNSLYYGLGLDRDRDPFDVDSAPSAAIAELCERFVGGFGPGERAVFENARRRRNAELHSALAAMEGLDRGWRGRLFATCRVLLAHLKLSLTDLLGSEAGHLAERLVVEDAASVRKEVEATIESARKRFAKLPGAQRETRRQKAEAGLRFDPLGGGQPTTRPGPSRLLREVPCPACQTRVGLTGEVVTRNRALRSFEWTPGAFSAKEVPATEQVYGPEQADGTCTGVCAPNLGGARRRRVARHGPRVKRRRELTGRFAGRTW